MDPVRLDFGNLMAPGLTGGVDRQRFEGDLADAFGRAHAAVEATRSTGVLGFLDLFSGGALTRHPIRQALLSAPLPAGEGLG